MARRLLSGRRRRAGNSDYPGLNALAVDGDGNLYVGGNFTRSDYGSANNVAKWDGMTWSALGAGVEVPRMHSGVLALAVDSGGNLYAGGAFTAAGSETVNHVAKWDGTNWSPLGTGWAMSFTASVHWQWTPAATCTLAEIFSMLAT